ncbi:MAG TPA: hypothetical protein VLU25_13500 [Acidobacteriota bacterium]|nr:hypothetical protein [Acidobacteriota bacterium]
MNRLKILSIAAVLLLLSAPMALAQDGYGDFPQEVQSTNSPAGTVVEPGSQLLFLLDTGIRPSEINPDFVPTLTVTENFGLEAPLWTNFIAITNTNPTDAVTLHFRYFDESCDDVVDFLVLLTCNDTMLINPFDYTIPGTEVNVSDFFFGTPPQDPTPLSTARFGEGRFLLFVTASGDAGNDSGDGNDTSPAGDRGDFDDPEDLDEFADWLYPFELTPDDLEDDCVGVDPDKIGVRAGVNDDNLNIFNASAISFNYLNGFHTIGAARPGGQASFAVTAWTRPAINAGQVLDCDDADLFEAGQCTASYNNATPQDVDGDGDFDAFDADAVNDGGMDVDGPLAPKGVILSGTEHIWLTLLRSDELFLPTNSYYLRQDAHGGNSIETNCEGATSNQPRCDSSNPWAPQPVVGGSLGWTLFPDAVSPADQFLSFGSFKDDYNGSLNLNRSAFAVFSDNAYRMDAAATYYNLVIFNNSEDPLRIEEEIEQISPPPPIDPVVIRVAVKCLNAFRFDVFGIPGGELVPGGGSPDFVFTENFATFSLDDLFTLDGRGLAANFLADPVVENDELGPGWVRFDRILTRDFWYDATGGSIQGFAVNYDGERGSYVTIAQSIVFLDSFGLSYWLPLSASGPLPPSN